MGEDTKFAGAFTNRPGGEGEDVTKESYWTDYEDRIPSAPPGEQKSGSGGWFESTGTEDLHRRKAPERPAGPIGDFVGPDYSRRNGFESFVFEQMGVNPFKLNPNDMVKRADESLPQLFKHVFGSKVLWSDRGSLDPKKQKFWDTVVQRYRAEAYDNAAKFKEQKVQEHNFMMNQFDNAANQYKSDLEAYRKAGEAARKEGIKRGDVKYKREAERAKAEAKAGPSREDIVSLSSMDRRLTKQLNDDGDVDPQLLRQRNRAARTVKLPTVKRTEIKSGSAWWKKFIAKTIELIPGEFGEDYAGGLRETSEVGLQEEPAGKVKPGAGDTRRIVESRTTKDGRKIVRYSDGTIELVK